MSRYAHLPIFQKSYDLTIRFFQETHNFSREHKFTIGQKIKDIILTCFNNSITSVIPAEAGIQFISINNTSRIIFLICESEIIRASYYKYIVILAY